MIGKIDTKPILPEQYVIADRGMFAGRKEKFL